MPTARTHTSNAERIGHNQGDIIRRREAWSRRYRESDEAAGIETTDEFEPFEQRNDMFTLAFWDDRIKSLSTAEQNQSRGRRKISPLDVMPYTVLRVVPVVHRRDPRCFV